MHPLVGSLEKLSNDELYAKVAELQRKISASYGLGYGSAVQQLQMILEVYQSEIATRQAKMMEDMQNRSKEFKNIIDIK